MTKARTLIQIVSDETNGIEARRDAVKTLVHLALFERDEEARQYIVGIPDRCICDVCEGVRLPED